MRDVDKQELNGGDVQVVAGSNPLLQISKILCGFCACFISIVLWSFFSTQ